MLSPSSNDEDELRTDASQIRLLFPQIVDGKIKTEEFLAAARGIVRIVEKLGKVFAPVKYDIRGNINKLTAKYETDKEKHATLQDMILSEKMTEKKLLATDALVWLTRGLHMILLFFEKILEDGKTGAPPTEDLVAFLKKSYKEALEPYHGWMAQQLFDLLSRMVPTRTQLLAALTDKRIDENDIVVNDMELYLMRLRENVSTVQLFCRTHDLEAMIQ